MKSHRHAKAPRRLVQAAAVAAAVVVPAETVSAATTYYIDSNRPGCTDNPGTGSESNPWCGFAQINQKTLGPGDKVLLARGASWNEQLSLKGMGEDGSPIVVDAYPPANGNQNTPLPLIGYNEQKVGILLTNPSHLVLRNVEIDGRENGGPGKLTRGIEIYYSEANKKNISIEDIYLHHNSIGLLIAGSSSLPRKDPALRTYTQALTGLRVVRVRGEHNESSIATTRYWPNDVEEAIKRDPRYNPVVKDALFSELSLIEDDGVPISPETDAEGNSISVCGSAFQISRITNATVVNSLINRGGGCYAKLGTTGIFLGHAADVRIVNNVVLNTSTNPNSDDERSPDKAGILYQTLTDKVATLGNYVSGTGGPGITVLGLFDDTESLDVTIASNVVIRIGNNVDSSLRYSFFAAGSSVGTSISTGVLANNIYGGQFAYPGRYGVDFCKFRIEYNQKARSGTNDPDRPNRAEAPEAWFSVNDFFSTRKKDFSPTAGDLDRDEKGVSTQGFHHWQYRYSLDSGQTFRNLIYVRELERWRPQDRNYPTIDAWNMNPGENGILAARTWKAPRDGIVAIHGYALNIAAGGDGAGVQITRQRARPGGWEAPTVVFPRRAVDNVLDYPVWTTVRQFEVAEGDLVNFLVDSGGNGHANDLVSWAPSVAYVDDVRNDAPDDNADYLASCEANGAGG